jgi:hypothetical protein
VGSIDIFLADINIIKSIAHIIEILTNNRPTLLDKISIEPIWSWCFVRGQRLNHLINFLIGERSNKSREISICIQKIVKIENNTSEAINTQPFLERLLANDQLLEHLNHPPCV